MEIIHQEFLQFILLENQKIMFLEVLSKQVSVIQQRKINTLVSM